MFILLFFTHKAIKIPWSKPLNGCETHFVGPAVFGLLHVRTFSSCSLTMTFKIGRHKANLEFALHEVIIHLQVSFKIYMALTLAITTIVLNAFLYLMSFGLTELVPENCSSNI